MTKIEEMVLYLTLSKGTSAQQASKEDKRAQRTCNKFMKKNSDNAKKIIGVCTTNGAANDPALRIAYSK